MRYLPAASESGQQIGWLALSNREEVTPLVVRDQYGSHWLWLPAVCRYERVRVVDAKLEVQP